MMAKKKRGKATPMSPRAGYKASGRRYGCGGKIKK